VIFLLDASKLKSCDDWKSDDMGKKGFTLMQKRRKIIITFIAAAGRAIA